jgi:hypothetical protein
VSKRITESRRFNSSLPDILNDELQRNFTILKQNADRRRRAGMKVSWQVTGVRQEAWPQAHPLQVKADKEH